MASFRQMTNDKVIKRADAEKIRYQDIHVEPGFNPAGRMDDDEDGESLFQYLMSGGRVPALEVRPRDHGGVFIVDGHRRHYQIGRAIAAGAPLQDPRDGEVWIDIKQFVGNDVDRTCRIVTSNEGKKLTAVQLADVYKRLAGFGLSNAEIARRVCRTASHVEQILLLGNANHDIQAAVARGEVSASLAIDTVRAHGEAAGAVLAAEVQKAKAEGRSKLTPAALRPWAPPRKLVAPMVNHARTLLDSMPKDLVAAASNAANFDLAEEPVTVTLSTKALYLFAQTVLTVEDARNDAERRKASKANATKGE